MVVVSLEKGGSSVGDDGESKTAVGVRIDREMGLNVDGISLMPAAAHGATVSCRASGYLVRSGG